MVFAFLSDCIIIFNMRLSIQQQYPSFFFCKVFDLPLSSCLWPFFFFFPPMVPCVCVGGLMCACMCVCVCVRVRVCEGLPLLKRNLVLQHHGPGYDAS